MTLVMTMVTNTNRGRPRAELRQQIVDAAIAVLRERGYEAATIEAITARAGVAKGTFFNFYRSKIDLLAEYYRGLDAAAARWRAQLDPHQPLASLCSYAAAIERLFRGEGRLLADLMRLTASDRQMRRLDEESGASDAAQFAAFLERAKACGTIQRDVDTEEAGEIIVDLWSGSVRRWRTDTGPGLSELFGVKLDLFLRGIGGRVP